MTDDDTISYDEYQKLPKEEKQNFETHWNSDGKSGYATRKGTKLPEAKSTIPVTELKQGDPTVTVKDAVADAEAKGKAETTDKINQIGNSLKVKINRIRNYLKDETDTTATDKSINPFQIATDTTDKANQLSDSLKAKIDTTATDKSINPFQAGKEVADKAVEDASILLDRVKQSADKIDSIFSKNWNTFSLIDPDSDKKLLELEKETEAQAKELGIDIGSLSAMKRVGNTIAPSRASQIKRLKKINKELNKAAEERLAATKTIQQEAQANYTKTEEETAKRKAESKPTPKTQKDTESTRNQLTKPTPKEQDSESKAETETEKDETKEPLKKVEELEQPQTPVDIKRFSNDLNRFVIQAYLNGDFGKKSSPNAIASMGYFILDKIGTALVNASQVARGMSPSAKSQWSKVLDKQTELLGKRITSEWFLSQPTEKQIALIRMGYVPGASSQTVYENTDPNAIDRAEQRDILGISKLSQEQKGVAQSNVNALLARKSELQTLITQLKSDQGWEVYTQVMNAVVGTAKGLSSLGVTDNSSSSSNKGFSDTLSADVKTGKLPSAFVSGGISNSSSWNNSSAEALSKSNSLSQDALALSKFKTGEEYANATREAKKAANEQLIKRLEGQIEIIDKCIDSWGKDLGL